MSFAQELFSVLSELNRILQTHSKTLPKENLRVLIGFDEIQNIHSEESKDYLKFRQKFSGILALIERYQKEVLNRFAKTRKEELQTETVSIKQWRLYFPLLSTQSRLSDLTAKEIREISYRGKQYPTARLPLFIAFPFDVFMSDEGAGSIAEINTLEKCTSMEIVKKLGRPL